MRTQYQYLRSLYDERIKAGNCPKCGHPKDEPEFVVCSGCRLRRKMTQPKTGGGGGKRVNPHESVKWAALDASMRFACEVCGLRGEHECLEGDATARPGPGRVFPDSGGY